MNLFDVQMYLIIKLLLIIFLGAGIFIIYKRYQPIYFLVLFGLISATAYILFVNNLGLLLWGLQGDEVTISAMYNNFASSGIFGSDFAFHQLSSFYPPAFFWFFGQFGKLMSLNGVVIAKLASTTFFFSFPIVLYFFQKGILSKKERFFDNDLPGKIFIFLSPLLIMTILDKDVLIGKPYEVLAVGLSIFWYLGLYASISGDKWTKSKALIYGLIAGLIFMLYYLWLIFAALALVALAFSQGRAKIKIYFFRLLQTMLVAMVVAAPFLGPLFLDYWKFGMESWQTALFIPSGLDLWLPMFKNLSFINILLLFGLGTMIYYRNNKFIRPLLYLFLTTFIWWLGGIISLLFFQKPFQEFRGFYILAPSILSITAAYGLERLWNYYRVAKNQNFYYLACVLATGLLASQAIFGFFIDDPAIKNRRVESRNVPNKIVNLSNYLKSDSQASSKLTLQTIPQIMAFVPINNLLYYNQHNNHPAAIFSKRYQYVQDLADSDSAEELYKKIQLCPYGQLEQFIFHDPDQNYYYLYFHLDKFIEGTEEQIIKFDKSLFSPDFFEIKYNSDNIVVIDIKANK